MREVQVNPAYLSFDDVCMKYTQNHAYLSFDDVFMEYAQNHDEPDDVHDLEDGQQTGEHYAAHERPDDLPALKVRRIYDPADSQSMSRIQKSS